MLIVHVQNMHWASPTYKYVELTDLNNIGHANKVLITFFFFFLIIIVIASRCIFQQNEKKKFSSTNLFPQNDFPPKPNLVPQTRLFPPKTYFCHQILFPKPNFFPQIQIFSPKPNLLSFYPQNNVFPKMCQFYYLVETLLSVVKCHHVSCVCVTRVAVKLTVDVGVTMSVSSKRSETVLIAVDPSDFSRRAVDCEWATHWLWSPCSVMIFAQDMLFIFMLKVQQGQMVSIAKYRSATQYQYQTFKVSMYRLTTGWFICNVISGYHG